MVKLLDVTSTSQGVGIVFEHFEKSLCNFLAESSEGGFVHPDIMQDICRKVARGLKHVHSKDVIHGDVKPANILVEFSASWAQCFPNPGESDFESNLKVVLADFGGSLGNSNHFATPVWPKRGGGGHVLKFAAMFSYSWIS